VARLPLKLADVTPSELRASDEDREGVVRALERHTAAGRLSLDEYAERVDQALAARTHGDLALVVGDLPQEPAATEEPAAAPAGRSELAVAFLVAVAALLLIASLVWVFG
jgi:hypothetical protein